MFWFCIRSPHLALHSGLAVSEAGMKGLSYSVKLFGTARLSRAEPGRMAFKWVQLRSLPQVRLGLSTSEGGLALPGKKRVTLPATR